VRDDLGGELVLGHDGARLVPLRPQFLELGVVFLVPGPDREIPVAEDALHATGLGGVVQLEGAEQASGLVVGPLLQGGGGRRGGGFGGGRWDEGAASQREGENEGDQAGTGFRSHGWGWVEEKGGVISSDGGEDRAWSPGRRGAGG
jgi:hypothetical protein